MSNPFTQLSDEQLASLGVRLRALALRLVADESAADDLAQEAWIVLQRRGDRSVREPGSFLAGVLRKLSLRRSEREQARRRRERAVARQEALPSPRELDATLHAQHVLVEELCELPDEQRELLLLRYYEDLSCAEIARRRGLAASTVRSQVSRGLRELRERLDRRYSGGRGVWALALFRMRGGEDVGAGIGSTSLGVLSMSALAKSAIVIGLAIAALVLWPERESPAPELEELPGLAARPEEPALENSVLQPGQLAPRERSAIGSPASATDGEMTPRGRVQVIDKESGVPAPHYGVRVLNAEGEERLVTSDATGEFLLEDELDDRDLTLIAVDHESLKLRNPAQLHLDPETRNTRARAHIFEVDLGPTYRLQLPAGTPRGQLRAFLSTEKYTKSELGGSLERGAVVREGPRPWVRLAPFPGVRTPVLGDEPWYLILHDGLGYWQAWGAVDSIVGVHERIVTFESRLFGRAEIRLRADGLPPRGEMVLHVGPDPRHRAAAGTDDDRLRRRTVSIRKGQELEPGLAVLHYLPEGDYLGQSEAGRGFEFRRVPFEVHGGETTRVELELEQTEGGHDLIVILASESGTVDFSRVVLYAHPTEEGQSKKRWARIELDSPPGEGHYYFENLESGPWRIEIPTIGTFPPFDSENNRIVDADAGEVRFTCLDGSGAEMVSLRVKVVDAETGADVQSPAITFWVDGQSFLSAGLTAGVNQLPSLAAGTRLDCIVQAPGYRPLIFEGGTYPPELPGKEIGEFRLERGWGMVVLTHRVHGGGGPLPGVLVHTDGLPAAVSDAHGRVVLAADEAPRSIKFALDGYQCLSDRDEEAIAKLLSWRGPSPVDVFFQAD